LKHLETRGLGGTLCEHVYRKGEPLNIENLGKDAPVDVRGLLKAGFQSYVGTPIVHKERTLGTLCLFDAAPHPVLENDLALLTAIGQQIGVAVENALLFEDVARERKVAQTLLDTAEALSTTLQLDKLLERVLDELQRVVPYDAASISMLHDEQCWIATSRGLTSTSAERFTLEERPLVRQVVHGRDLVIVPDVRHEPAWVAVEGTGDVRSWLGVPLIAKDRVIGVLMIDSHQPDTYDQEAGRLAFAFAHQVALAIDNSRLYEQTRAQLREAVLLHGVTAALSSTLDMDQMLSYVARSLGEGLNSTHVEIYSLDEEANTITVTTDYTAARPTADERHSNRGQTYPLADFPIIAEALAWNRPVQAKANNPGATSHEMAHLEARGAQAVLFLPMVAHGHTVGLAAVWEEQGPRRFTEGELAMGQTLTHQGAIALDNVRLFEETQHRVRELQLLHDVGLAAASGAALLDTLLATVNALATEFEGSRVAIALSNQEDHMLQMMVNANFPPEVNDVRIPIGEGISGWVAQHGEPVLVPDVRQDPRYIGIDLDTRSELCVPLSTGSLVIGILNIESPQVNTFTEDDLRLVNTLANNLAMFVERARLFEKVESARIELQQRAEALEEANARLGEANTRLQELDRLKSQFLANMSHELRTPLNSIIGFSEVLVDGLMGELPPDQKECAENILYSGDHLLALINDVLDLSKIEAGRMSLELVTFDVAEWLAEGQATIMALFEKKAQTLTVEMADDLPPLTADRFRVKQVLINLLSNANKFTPDEGRITISCRLADPATMLFSVADTGMGIKAEDQEIIFEEFCQSSDSSRQHIEGTGLGLTISKRLIEMHGGRIWVESEPEHGATFSFLLPLAGPLEPQPETKEAIALSTTGKTVLVVEDDRQFSNLLAFYLRQEGYAPVQHYSGAGVLERVLELKPSLITLDIMLPEQDGWEVLRTLKADPQTRDIPVMVISALESSELALSLGAAEYLDKPMHRSDLQDLLNQLAGPQPSGRKVRILVVDDDPDIIRLLGDMLSTADYTLLSACDGAEGFSLARSERPDAILLNLMMPGTDGFDMLEQLRADTETADIPVIVLTAIDVTTEQRELLQDNIQGLLRKSTLTPHALLEELRRLEELAAP
jgi:signal transduction histidine kinase/DNA-binding response OmpR family regulator